MFAKGIRNNTNTAFIKFLLLTNQQMLKYICLLIYLHIFNIIFLHAEGIFCYLKGVNLFFYTPSCRFMSNALLKQTLIFKTITEH